MLTERLEMIPLNEQHAGLLLAIFQDPDFIRYVGDKGLRTEAEAARFIRDGAMAEQTRTGVINYAVRVRGGSVWLGTCGLLQRPFFVEPDIGYGFLPAARGRGYAREAAQAVINHADQAGREKLWAMVHPENHASQKLLRSLGFVETQAHDCPLPNTLVLSRNHRPAC